MRAGQSTLSGTCNLRAQVAGRSRRRKPNTVCKSNAGGVEGNSLLSRPDSAKASEPVVQPVADDAQPFASNGQTDSAGGNGDTHKTAEASPAATSAPASPPTLKQPAPPRPPSRPKPPSKAEVPALAASRSDPSNPSEAAIAAALKQSNIRKPRQTGKRSNWGGPDTQASLACPPGRPQPAAQAPMSPSPAPAKPFTSGPPQSAPLASSQPPAQAPPAVDPPTAASIPIVEPPAPLASQPRPARPQRPAAPPRAPAAQLGSPSQPPGPASNNGFESPMSSAPPQAPPQAAASPQAAPPPRTPAPPRAAAPAPAPASGPRAVTQFTAPPAEPTQSEQQGAVSDDEYMASSAVAGPLAAAPPLILAAPTRLAAPVRPAAPLPRRGGQAEQQVRGGEGGNTREGAGGGRGGGGGGGGRPPNNRGAAPGRGRQVFNTQGRRGRGGGGRGGGRDGGYSRQGRGRPTGGQTGNLTAANRRKARQIKKEALAAKRQSGRKVREEIFEVPSTGLSVDTLAERLAVNKAEIVKILFMKGVMVQVNQMLDTDTVRLAAAALGAEAIIMDEDEVAAGSAKREEFVREADLEYLVTRPPVVCVMGHVDHGKTSLLDRIRAAAVAAGEAGGITQAIGAYNVLVEGEETSSEICFLDTPGHEAFSAMRARGAKVTDIAVVIVAADDGVRPQTLEAIAHARAAAVPIVVAVNKIDKPGADVNRVLSDMAAQADLVPEEWGGDVPFVPISAKKGDGIDELLETLALVAEIEELQANPNRAAEGTVLEAHLDKQVGPVASLLVQAGTIAKGDVVQAGAACGRVRACRGSYGENVESAGPSTAVSVEGLDEVPAAGDVFRVFKDEAEARSAAEAEKEAQRTARLAEMSSSTTVTLSTLATVDEDQEALQRMNLVVKADASGSLEAIKGALRALPQDSVALRFLLAGTGPITPSDVELARSSGALVMGFNVEPTDEAAALAKNRAVEVATYDVIYGLLDEVRARMEGRLKAVTEKVQCGAAEVKATFGRGKNIIGGCIVTEGKVMVNGVVEVRRGRKTLVYEGPLSSLRRFKDEVAVVEEGVECGIGCEGFWEWEAGDKVACFELVEKTLTLEESRADSAVDGDLDDALAEAQAEYAASVAAEAGNS
eukprot:jgi/Ulvmu1/10865/UM007_0039.1